MLKLQKCQSEFLAHSQEKNEHGNGRVVTTVEMQFVLMAGRETCQVNHYLEVND